MSETARTRCMLTDLGLTVINQVDHFNACPNKNNSGKGQRRGIKMPSARRIAGFQGSGIMGPTLEKTMQHTLFELTEEMLRLTKAYRNCWSLEAK
jgi:hypothetical protein